jgi:hypothetical protein
LGGIERHQRLATVCSLIDGAAEDASIGADRLVRLPEMFLGAILD